MTSLFAALDVVSGFVIGKCYRRHRAAEFLNLLKEIDAQVPEGLATAIHTEKAQLAANILRVLADDIYVSCGPGDGNQRQVACAKSDGTRSFASVVQW
jgi:hypothetical protein